MVVRQNRRSKTTAFGHPNLPASIENGDNYRAIFHASRDALLVADAATGKLLDANPAAIALLDRSLEEIRKLHQQEIHAPEDVEAGRAAFQKYCSQAEASEHVVIRPNGTRVPVEIASSPLRDPRGAPLVLGVLRDLTERRRAEQAVLDSAEQFRGLFEGSADYIYIHDFDGNFLDMNPAGLKALGYQRADITSLNLSSLISPSQLSTAFTRLREFEATGIRSENPNFRLKTRTGTFVDVETTITIIPFERTMRAILGVARDITERLRADKALHERADLFRMMSRHDNLTGLPNRVFLDERLADVQAAGALSGNFAMAYIDLDLFKEVNDAHGHAVGDAFLRIAASRFQSVLREHDVLARIGGDEFVAVLAGVDDRKEAARRGRRLLRALKRPLQLREHLQLQCTASIGIALFPSDGSTPAELERSADDFMYIAKSRGKNQVQVCARLPLQRKLRSRAPPSHTSAVEVRDQP